MKIIRGHSQPRGVLEAADTRGDHQPKRQTNERTRTKGMGIDSEGETEQDRQGNGKWMQKTAAEKKSAEKETFGDHERVALE